MNKAMLAIGIIFIGIIAFGVFNVIHNYTIGNELDYYLLKETTEAAMVDAIDDNQYLREYGTYRMDKAKFVESFALHFVSNVDTRRTYDVKFYDIHEVPPKVTVRVDSKTSARYDKLESDGAFEDGRIQIRTDISSIVESKNISDPVANRLLEGKE